MDNTIGTDERAVEIEHEVPEPAAYGGRRLAGSPAAWQRGCRRPRGERGMVSAEWAVGIIAAIAIAGVLLAVVTSGPVEKAILHFILMVIGAFARHIGDF